MPYKKVQWFCKKCGTKLETRDEALNCEQTHYRIKRILWKKYGKHRAPEILHVEIDIGGDIKEVNYVLSQEGWGER